MNVVINKPTIHSISFLKNELLIALDNDRLFIVPLEKFPAIQQLSLEERNDYEIIDNSHLSFLTIDDVYSIEELIGLPI